jgi:hypothetical protein
MQKLRHMSELFCFLPPRISETRAAPLQERPLSYFKWQAVRKNVWPPPATLL